MRTLPRLLPLLLLAGCLNLGQPGPLDGVYKDDFTFLPDRDRARAAFVLAVQDPWTWQPLVGGLVLEASDFDEVLTDSARESQPLFGSRDSAADASDGLLVALRVASVASTVSLEGLDEVPSWSGEKNEDLGAHVIATGLGVLAAEGTQELVERRSPDDSGADAFPSRGSTEAFLHAAWIRRSLRAAEVDSVYAASVGAGATALAVGSAWAEVEAGEHHLGDVLAAMALGNFATVFVNEAFLGQWQSREVRLAVVPYDEAYLVGVRWGF